MEIFRLNLWHYCFGLNDVSLLESSLELPIDIDFFGFLDDENEIVPLTSSSEIPSPTELCIECEGSPFTSLVGIGTGVACFFDDLSFEFTK